MLALLGHMKKLTPDGPVFDEDCCSHSFAHFQGEDKL